ncbi:MAG TPA: CpsD/CapB family tyrosine-protein kinase [Candidatus Eisenbacteria bacterium]|nr:CpsD/CapB family tyrosine-protein kinase [Candidatus Eisenbacteria bacterium]
MSRTYDVIKQTESAKESEGNGVEEPIIDRVEAIVDEPRSEPSDDFQGNGHEAPPFELIPGPDIEEKYQKLRGSLFGGPKKNTIKTLLVVASDHGEGATTTATFLASVLAKSNRARVILVDANLRTPSPLSARRLNQGSKGFTELASGKAKLNEVVQPATFISPNLSVISAGRPLPSPSYLFDGDAIEKILAALRERYDYVIFDGAPVKDYSDSCFLGSKVDGAIIVVEAGKTRKETARGTKRQLERYGAKVLGTVLNKKKNYIPSLIDRFL